MWISNTNNRFEKLKNAFENGIKFTKLWYNVIEFKFLAIENQRLHDYWDKILVYNNKKNNVKFAKL